VARSLLAAFGMLARNVVLPALALCLLHPSLASAETEDEWFVTESEEPAPAAEAEPPAAGAEPASESAAPTQGAIELRDPARDEPAATKPRPRGARLHDGFYLRMSIGGGSVAARGERYDESDAATDYSFAGNALLADLAVGGTPSPGLVLGGAYLGSYAARGAARHRDADTG
jgi:hypothetical protein